MRQLLGPFAAALLLTMPACAQAPASPDSALIEDLVVANHILYDQGVVDGFGHVSVRSNKDPSHFLMARSMAPGLVTQSDILEFDLDGNAVDNPQGRAVYLERFIHFEIREAGGDATDMLVRNPQLGAALAHRLGSSSVLLMRGHGDVVVGDSVRLAVFRAIYTEVNAKLESEALRLGQVTFLNDKEAAASVATNSALVDRAWDLWKMKAMGGRN